MGASPSVNILPRAQGLSLRVLAANTAASTCRNPLPSFLFTLTDSQQGRPRTFGDEQPTASGTQAATR